MSQTASLEIRGIAEERPIALKGHFAIVLSLCWLLSAVCVSSDAGIGQSLGAYAIVKAGVRVIAILLLGWGLVSGDWMVGRANLLWPFIPLGVFGAWATVSTLWSPLKTISLTHGVELIMLVMLAMMVALTCRTEAALQRLLCHLAIIISVLSAAVIALNIPLMRYGLRPSLYMQPNNLAAIAATGLIITLASRELWNWRWTRVLLWPVVVICGGTMALARSRSCFIASSIVLIPMAWRLCREWLIVGLLLGAGLIAAAWPYSDTVASLPDTVTSYLMRGQNMEDAYTLSGRTELWSLAADSLSEAPLLGHGYYVLSSTGVLHVWGADRWQTAHNLYLHVLTGTGLIGLFLLIWAMVFILRPVLAAHRRNNPAAKVASLVLRCVVWCFALGFFELSFSGPVDPLVLVFFVFLGVGAGWCADQRPMSIHAHLAPA